MAQRTAWNLQDPGFHPQYQNEKQRKPLNVARQEGSGSKGACCPRLATGTASWMDSGEGRRELTPQSCPLTTHTPCMCAMPAVITVGKKLNPKLGVISVQ